jgi:hypothetical protein
VQAVADVCDVGYAESLLQFDGSLVLLRPSGVGCVAVIINESLQVAVVYHTGLRFAGLLELLIGKTLNESFAVCLTKFNRAAHNI